MTRTPDFIAELTYRPTEEGGRNRVAFSGYRPAIKFPFSEMQTSGQQNFIGKETVLPGESVTAEITILATEFFKNKLSVGLDFEFREGARIMGTGKIIKLLNKDLKIVTI